MLNFFKNFLSLGFSQDALNHWFWQRITAIIMIFLFIWIDNIINIQDILILLGELYESVLMFKNNVTDNINTVTIACQEFSEKNHQYKTKTLKLVDFYPDSLSIIRLEEYSS